MPTSIEDAVNLVVAVGGDQGFSAAEWLSCPMLRTLGWSRGVHRVLVRCRCGANCARFLGCSRLNLHIRFRKANPVSRMEETSKTN